MDISQEEIDEFFRKQERIQAEYLHSTKIIKEYKRRIKENSLNLSFEWETDINKIDLTKLNTTLIDEVTNNVTNNYEIMILELDVVVQKICERPEKVFPKNNLWSSIRGFDKIASLIEFIELGNKIIPPIILFHNPDSVAVIDGNHRIALSRFFKLEKIPFLVEKADFTKRLNNYL